MEDEIIELKTINARITEFVKLKNKLKKFKNNHLKKFMQKISNLNNTSFDITPELYDFMTWDYIKEMDQSDLITFGAHTVDHVSLTKVSKKQAQNQIKNSLFEVSEKLKRKIKFFSYPEGQQDDYDNEIINFLKSMKINHCPSAINGSNSLSNMDPFNLKRIMVGFEGRKFNLIT